MADLRAMLDALPAVDLHRLLSEAPCVACAWTEEEPIYGDSGEEWARRAPRYTGCRVMVGRVKHRRDAWAWTAQGVSGVASTREDAMAAADASLVSGGWRLA